jgi:hypothetical protein
MNINKAWLQKEIKNSIIKESIKREINLDESLASFAGKVIDKFGQIPVLGKHGIPYIKEYIFARICQRFKIKKNETMGQFVSSAIKRLSVEEIGELYSGEMPCEDITELFVEISSDILTKKMTKSILIYLIQHYNVNDIMNKTIDLDFNLLGDPNSKEKRKQIYIPGSFSYDEETGGKETAAEILSQEFLGKEFHGDTQALMSRNQAEQVLNSLIGILGQQFLEELVLKFVTSRIIVPMSDFICDIGDNDKDDEESNITKSKRVDTPTRYGSSKSNDNKDISNKIDTLKQFTGQFDNMINTIK